MALISPPRSRLKPAPWAFDPGLVAPEWRPVLRGLRFALPLWLDIADVVSGVRLTGENMTSGVPWTVGPRGYYIAFDGTDDYLNLPGADAQFDRWITDRMTVMCRARYAASQPDSYTTIFHQQMDDGSNDDVILFGRRNSNDAFALYNDDGSSNTGIEVGTISDDTWVDLAAVYDGTDRIAYIDSVEAGRGAWANTLQWNTGKPVTLGAEFNNGPTRVREFNGDLEYLYVWDRALSENELRLVHADPFGPFRPARRRVIVVSAGGTTFERTFTGSATASGLIVRQTQKTVAGTTTLTGALARQTQNTLTGSVTPSGTLDVLKTILQTFVGTLTAAGSLALQTAKTLTGSATPSGALTKQTAKSFSGSLTPSGTLEAIKTVLLSMAGSITTSGALTLQAAKDLAGSLTAAGSLTRRTDKTMAGSVTPSGTLQALRTVLLSIAGSLTPSGSLTKRISKTLTGSITPTGGLTKRISKLVVGALSLAGSLATSTALTLFPIKSETGPALHEPMFGDALHEPMFGKPKE